MLNADAIKEGTMGLRLPSLAGFAINGQCERMGKYDGCWRIGGWIALITMDSAYYYGHGDWQYVLKMLQHSLLRSAALSTHSRMVPPSSEEI